MEGTKRCIGCIREISNLAKVCEYCNTNQNRVVRLFNSYNSFITILFSALFFLLAFMQFRKALNEQSKALQALNKADSNYSKIIQYQDSLRIVMNDARLLNEETKCIKHNLEIVNNNIDSVVDYSNSALKTALNTLDKAENSFNKVENLNSIVDQTSKKITELDKSILNSFTYFNSYIANFYNSFEIYMYNISLSEEYRVDEIISFDRKPFIFFKDGLNKKFEKEIKNKSTKTISAIIRDYVLAEIQDEFGINNSKMMGVASRFKLNENTKYLVSEINPSKNYNFNLNDLIYTGLIRFNSSTYQAEVIANVFEYNYHLSNMPFNFIVELEISLVIKEKDHYSEEDFNNIKEFLNVKKVFNNS